MSFIVPAISAGVGIAGLFKKKKKSQSDMLAEQQQGLIKQQQQFGSEAFGMGKPLVQQGTSAMQKPLDFWSNILGGGEKSSQSLAGPMFDITSGYNRSRANTAQFAPRGSAASSYANDGRMMARDISRMRTDLLGTAAGQMSGIGSQLLTSGTNLMNTGQGGISNAMQAVLGQQGIQVQQDAARNQMFGGLGQGLGSILSVLLMPGGIFNKGTTKATPPIFPKG